MIPNTWHGVPTDIDSPEYAIERAIRAHRRLDESGHTPTPEFARTFAHVFREAARMETAERWQAVTALEAAAIEAGAVSPAQVEHDRAAHQARCEAASRAHAARIFGRDVAHLPREDAITQPCPDCGAGPGERCEEGCPRNCH